MVAVAVEPAEERSVITPLAAWYDEPDDDDDDIIDELPYSELREGDALQGQGGGEFIWTGRSVPQRVLTGNVYVGAVVASGVTVAIKVIDRFDIDGRPDTIKLLTRELNIKRKLRHCV